MSQQYFFFHKYYVDHLFILKRFQYVVPVEMVFLLSILGRVYVFHQFCILKCMNIVIILIFICEESVEQKGVKPRWCVDLEMRWFVYVQVCTRYCAQRRGFKWVVWQLKDAWFMMIWYDMIWSSTSFTGDFDINECDSLEASGVKLHLQELITTLDEFG